jgi:hypothetical protein
MFIEQVVPWEKEQLEIEEEKSPFSGKSILDRSNFACA